MNHFISFAIVIGGWLLFAAVTYWFVVRKETGSADTDDAAEDAPDPPGVSLEEWLQVIAIASRRLEGSGRAHRGWVDNAQGLYAKLQFHDLPTNLASPDPTAARSADFISRVRTAAEMRKN